MNKMKKWFDPRLTQIALYVIGTFVILFFLGKVLVSAGSIVTVLGKGLHWAGVILKPLLIGFAFAYILYPISVFFEKKLLNRAFFKNHGKTTHSLAVAATWLLIAAGIFLLLSIAISAVGRQLRAIQVEDLVGFVTSFFSGAENLLNQASSWIQELNVSSDDMQDVLETIRQWLQHFAGVAGEAAKNALSGIPGLLTNLLFSVIFGIYFMLDANGLRRYWDKVLRAITGEKGYAFAHQFFKDADTVFSGYIRGQLIDAVFMCIVVSAVLSLLQVPFAVIIGIMTGIGNLIPYVGPIVAYASTALVCLLQFDLQKLVLAIIAILVIQTIDGNVVNPRLLSKAISVHPMLVIAALLIGGAAGGIAGMLLAVPVAALVKIYFDRMINLLLDGKEKIKKKKNALAEKEGTEE